MKQITVKLTERQLRCLATVLKGELEAGVQGSVAQTFRAILKRLTKVLSEEANAKKEKETE